MTDLISREDVIRLLVDKYKFTTSEATEILSEIPSADAVSREDYHNLLMASNDIDRALREYQAKEESESAEATCATCADRAMCIMSAPDSEARKDYRAEAEPKRVLQGYCKGADCKWWNPQAEGCNRCVFVKEEYTYPSAEAVQGVGRYENAMQKLREMPRYLNGVKAKQINKIPSEAVQGEWTDIDDYYRMATCSRCHKVTMFEKWGEYTKPYDFCPHCGARMKGAEHEID